MKPIPIFDGHNDTLYHLFLPEKSKGRTFFIESTHGHLDYPRAKKGGLVGGLFGIYIPPPKSERDRMRRERLTKKKAGSYGEQQKPLEYQYAHAFANAVIDSAEQLETQGAGKIKIIRNERELTACIKKGILAMVLHLEGAEPINPELTDLEPFYRRGLRSLGLVWSRPTAFGYGVPFRYPHSPDTGPGLTKAGKKLVAACNELGIIIDLSHLNEKGFWDVAKRTKKPLVVTHAGVHALCPTSRNLTDKQLDAVGDSGGVIGVMFQPTQFAFGGNIPSSDKKGSITEIIRHIDYIVDRIGIDHVALGSDFDGARMPPDLKDAAELPNLVHALRTAGYDTQAIERIAYKNWLRVIKETWIR